jgi:hypothetical protein
MDGKERGKEEKRNQVKSKNRETPLANEISIKELA